MMRASIKLTFFLVSILGSIPAFGFYDQRVIDNSPAALEERLTPPGLPDIHIQQVVAADSAVEGGGLGLSGEQLYTQYCSACHAAGVAGAPKLGDKAAWKPRVDQGIEKLLQHATQGLNAMPPKGTCVQCSSADLKMAIEYMINHP